MRKLLFALLFAVSCARNPTPPPTTPPVDPPTNPPVETPTTPPVVHFDPMTASLEQLARVRGAMWTAKLNLAWGPRPNQDSNVLAMVFYDLYGTEDRTRMRAAYKQRGYTHSVTGPITGNDCYHGAWPCRMGIPTQEQWDAYLDSLQELWDDGIFPIYFAHPDGWTLPNNSAGMDQLDALYRQERAQKLLRIVVYSGWEPSGDKYGWNNAQYVAWVKRGVEVFPNSLRLLHLVSDLDAPTGQDDDRVLPAGQGNVVSWRNVTPYIHGYLAQFGGYVSGNNEVPTQKFKDDFAYAVRDYVRRFKQGYAGWPTTSAWGNQPLKFYAGEYAAYGVYWHNWDEKYSVELGNLAVANGADGYLDGGNADVP